MKSKIKSILKHHDFWVTIICFVVLGIGIWMCLSLILADIFKNTNQLLNDKFLFYVRNEFISSGSWIASLIVIIVYWIWRWDKGLLPTKNKNNANLYGASKFLKQKKN